MSITQEWSLPSRYHRVVATCFSRHLKKDQYIIINVKISRIFKVLIDIVLICTWYIWLHRISILTVLNTIQWNYAYHKLIIHETYQHNTDLHLINSLKFQIWVAQIEQVNAPLVKLSRVEGFKIFGPWFSSGCPHRCRKLIGSEGGSIYNVEMKCVAHSHLLSNVHTFITSQ